MTARACMWFSTALAVAAVVAMFSIGAQTYGLGLGLGFIWGVVTVGFAIETERSRNR